MQMPVAEAMFDLSEAGTVLHAEQFLLVVHCVINADLAQLNIILNHADEATGLAST